MRLKHGRDHIMREKYAEWVGGRNAHAAVAEHNLGVQYSMDPNDDLLRSFLRPRLDAAASPTTSFTPRPLPRVQDPESSDDDTPSAQAATAVPVPSPVNSPYTARNANDASEYEEESEDEGPLLHRDSKPAGLEDSAQQSKNPKTQLRELHTLREEELAARRKLERENEELLAELQAVRDQSRMDRLTAEVLEAYLTQQEEENDELRTELHTLECGAQLQKEKCLATIAERRTRGVPKSAAQLASLAAEAAAATPGAEVLDERLGYRTRIVRLPGCGTEVLVPQPPDGQQPLPAAIVLPTEVALLTLNVDSCVSAPNESRELKVRRVAELAKKHRAGIVVLQEARAEYDTLLREALPAGWGVASAATGTPAAAVQERHVFAWDPTVVARLQEPPSALLRLTSSFRRPPVAAHFALQNGGSLLIASVHAAPEQDDAKKEAAALGAEMLPLLGEQYGEPVLRTLVVCGDFNLAPPGELLEPKSGRAFGGLLEMGWVPTNRKATNLTVLTESPQEQVYDNVFVHQSVQQALKPEHKTAEVLKFDELVLDDWRRAEEQNGRTRGTSRLTPGEKKEFYCYLKGEYAKLRNTDPQTISTNMSTKWLSHGLGYSDHRGLLLRIPAAALRHEAKEGVATMADATTSSGKSRAMRALVEAMSTAVVHAVEDRAARDERARDARDRQEHLEAKFANKPRCQGITKTGKQCLNYAGVCRYHPLCSSYIQVDVSRPRARGASTTMYGLHFELCSNLATTDDDRQHCHDHAVTHTDCVLRFV